MVGSPGKARAGWIKMGPVFDGQAGAGGACRYAGLGKAKAPLTATPVVLFEEPTSAAKEQALFRSLHGQQHGFGS